MRAPYIECNIEFGPKYKTRLSDRASLWIRQADHSGPRGGPLLEEESSGTIATPERGCYCTETLTC